MISLPVVFAGVVAVFVGIGLVSTLFVVSASILNSRQEQARDRLWRDDQGER
jgi:NADH:ubiquinone oxidoreductase subunit 6 (subunit J)